MQKLWSRVADDNRTDVEQTDDWCTNLEERWQARPYLIIGVKLNQPLKPPTLTPVGADDETWTLKLQPDVASLPDDGRAWAERYETSFSKPPDDEAILGADAISFIAAGSKKVGEDDRRELAKELLGRTEFDGVTGKIVRKKARTIRPMWVERVVKGKRLAIEPVPE